MSEGNTTRHFFTTRYKVEEGEWTYHKVSDKTDVFTEIAGNLKENTHQELKLGEPIIHIKDGYVYITFIAKQEDMVS